MPIVIWAGQGRDSPLVYFQQKQNIKRRSGSVYSKVTKSRHPEQKEWQAVKAAYNFHFSKVPPYTLQLCEMLAVTVLIFNFLIPVKLIGIKSFFPLEHVINRTPEFLCNYAHGFCLSIPLHKFIMPPLATFIIAEKENCTFWKRPFEMHVSDFIMLRSTHGYDRDSLKMLHRSILPAFSRRSLPFSFFPADSWEHFTRRQ